MRLYVEGGANRHSFAHGRLPLLCRGSWDCNEASVWFKVISDEMFEAPPSVHSLLFHPSAALIFGQSDLTAAPSSSSPPPMCFICWHCPLILPVFAHERFLCLKSLLLTYYLHRTASVRQRLPRPGKYSAELCFHFPRNLQQIIAGSFYTLLLINCQTKELKYHQASEDWSLR